MLRYNLAVELAPEYGRPLSEQVAIGATKSMAAIKRMNSKPLYLKTDAPVARKTRTFNWLTGE